MKMPNVDPITIALGRTEQFKMETAQRELDLARLNKQARELMVMHAFFDTEAREAGTVTPDRSLYIDGRLPKTTLTRYFNEPDKPMFVYGNFKGYSGVEFPQSTSESAKADTPRGQSDQGKLCAVFDHATLYIPRTSEEYLLETAGEVHIPILSITSIRRRLQQGAA